jgi:DNA-binding CsgD family transcriptional regulator
MSSAELLQLRSLLSGNDAITLLELIHRSLSCVVKEDFIDLFPKIQKLFPFDFACTILGYHDNDDIVVVDGINISYPTEFYKEYKLKNYFKLDAVVKENFTAYKRQYWCVDKKRPYQSEEVVLFAIDFGMRAGYAHGSRPFGTEKYGSLFSFAANSLIKSEMRTDTILEVVIPHLHLALSKVCNKKQIESNDIVLSAREKEVLDWVKQGKSSWEISVILCISESTVNFHIYNIMQKLGTINRPQSIAVAARLGLIDLD